MSRDYDNEPIVVEFTVRIFVYEDMPVVDLNKRINSICNDQQMQEAIFDMMEVADNAGLDEITGKIVA